MRRFLIALVKGWIVLSFAAAILVVAVLISPTTGFIAAGLAALGPNLTPYINRALFKQGVRQSGQQRQLGQGICTANPCVSDLRLKREARPRSRAFFPCPGSSGSISFGPPPQVTMGTLTPVLKNQRRVTRRVLRLSLWRMARWCREASDHEAVELRSKSPKGLQCL